MPVTDTAPASFTPYAPAQLAGIQDDLQHLRALDDGPRAGAGAPDTPLPAGAHVLTARVGARLAGYVAGVPGEVIDVRDVVVAPAARHSHPQLAGALVEEFVERAALPWADVVVPRHPTALAHLISTGWSPVADADAQRRGAVRLSAARGAGA